ncbi:FRG1-like family-domain-containing protein [Spinellus fusiger]|nr:FRG1-like family-domain-containing protein [Spinellus fusiger]
MATAPPKKGKLLFKGDKEKKKKKRKHDALDEERHGSGTLEHGWVLAEVLDDLVGPLFFTQPNDPPICFTVDDNDRLIAYPLPSQPDTPNTPNTPEPLIVNQVLVGSRLMGSTGAFTFKSFNTKYLGCDKFGVVECNREAIGATEEWEPSFVEGGVVLKSALGKFLMIDEIAGGGFKIRADADTFGFCETFRVYCQARFKHKNKPERKTKTHSGKDEMDTLKKYQSWGNNQLKMTQDDSHTLKKARQEGRFSEAMLDRREKVKADRYCK